MAQMTSRYTASHRDVVKSRNQASGLWIITSVIHKQENNVSCFSWGRAFSSVKLQKILHKIEQQSYTPVTSKEPEDSRKLGSTQNNIWDMQESVQEACFENFNPWVIKRNTITGKKMENHLTGVFPAVLGLNIKILLSKGWLFPALTAESTAHTVSSTFCPLYRAWGGYS